MPGYSFPPTKKVKDGHKCPHCHLILREAVQTVDGHRLCRDCCEEIKTQKSNGGCCEDCEISISPDTEVYPDKAARREIALLEVSCHNSSCKWTGYMSSAEQHATECPCRLINCPNTGCGHTMIAREYDNHLAECPSREVQCDFCHLSIPFSLVDAHHEGECQHFPFPCEWCSQRITLHERESHLKVCNLVNGRMQEDGYATFQERPVQNTQSHEVRSEPVCPPIRVPGQCNLMMELQRREFEAGGSQYHQFQRELWQLNGRISEFEHSMRWVHQFPFSYVPSATAQHLQHIGECAQRLGQCVTRLTLGVTSTIHPLEDVEVTRNGECVWRIPNIHRKHWEAVNGHITCLTSSHFHTHPHGYKMCLSLYLNGDGAGKGTHISLFFSVMPSDHDDFLCWPFKQLVHLTLVNQGTPSASITRTFRPDPTSSAFKRPVGDMNIASGYSKFSHQSIIDDGGFTHDDIIYVKCDVDLNGLL